jgi:hypothetical protein
MPNPGDFFQRTPYLMSNSLANMSDTVERIFAETETAAYALAMGKDTFADVGDKWLRAAESDDSVSPDMVRPFYIGVYSRARTIASANHKVMKDQTDKSRDSQISKMVNFVTIGTAARDNDAVIPAYEYGRKQAAGGYTKVVKALVAMKAVLVKRPDADEEALKAAIDAALTEKPVLASEEVAKVEKAWEKLAFGDEKSGYPFEREFAALLAGYPGDNHAKRIGGLLAQVRVIFEKAEKAAEPLPSLSN